MLLIRAGRDADAAGVVALISRCWGDYPNCVMDADAEPGLRAPAAYYAAQGGALWVAEDAGVAAGMIAVAPRGDGGWEVCRVYVHPDRHGAGLAHRLLDLAEAHAVAAGATRLLLWSDTRFDRAHRFYEKRSYVRTGPIRALEGDSSVLEFGYVKPLDGVQVLDAAAAASAVRRLAEVFVAGVADGAAVCHLPPLDPGVAQAQMRRVASGVAQGTCVLLGGWVGGVLAGTVRVELDTPPNQRHRAQVATPLVDPAWRRRGLGRALMMAAEAEAGRAGRTLMTLQCQAGSVAERLCASMGWTAAGRIPGYTRDGAGRSSDATVLYKVLS